jgi:hypothetical protein
LKSEAKYKHVKGSWKVDGKLNLMVAVFLALLIGACATSTDRRTQRLEENWQGKHVNDLIALKGQPDEKFGDGQGGQIFDYESYESESGSESAKSGSSPPGGGSGGGSGGGRGSGRHGGGSGGGGSSRRGSSKTAYLMHQRFWINPEGYIYRASYVQEGR